MAFDVAVIGAGMAGLAAARSFAANGHSVQIFDKGRGVGGRLSTRRTEWGAFDHGAQYATVRDPAFSSFIAELQQQGAVHIWDSVRSGAVIGKPGMSALVKAGLDGQHGIAVKTGFEVAHIGSIAEGLVLSDADGTHEGPFDRVVVTAPAPQAAALLRAFGEPFQRLDDIQYAPSYTLLAAFDAVIEADDLPELAKDGDLSIACRQAARGPGRKSEHDLWVVQASAAVSKENLEREREAMVPVLLRLFQEAIGSTVPQPIYAAGHRWRYGLVETPLAEPFLLSADGRIGVAGDGLLGPRIELAFLSGVHCAQAMMDRG